MPQLLCPYFTKAVGACLKPDLGFMLPLDEGAFQMEVTPSDPVLPGEDPKDLNDALYGINQDTQISTDDLSANHIEQESDHFSSYNSMDDENTEVNNEKLGSGDGMQQRNSFDDNASVSSGSSYQRNQLIVNTVESALRLHDEVTATLIANKVDRFDKYSNMNDPMTQQALEHASMRNGQVGHLRFTPAYWHGWAKTRNVLERNSEKRRRQEAAEAALLESRGDRHVLRGPRIRDDPEAKKTPWRRHKKGFLFGNLNGFQPPEAFDIPEQPSVAHLYQKQYNCELPPYPEEVPYDSFRKVGTRFGTGSARDPGNKSSTVLCNVATVAELLGPMGRKPARFGQSTRFASGDSRPSCPVTTYTGPRDLEAPYYHNKFAIAERFEKSCGTREGGNSQSAVASAPSAPSPTTYNITRMFDEKRPIDADKTRKAQQRTLDLLKDQRTLRDSSSSDLAQICTFAYGCNFEEHRQYGVCLDGMCGRRAQFEDLILLSNKEDAFKGTSPDKMKKSLCRPIKLPTLVETPSHQLNQTEALQGDAQIRSDVLSTRYSDDSCMDDMASPKKSVSPMQAAIIAADYPRIKRLVDMGYNINEVDSRNGRTVVHHLVFMRHISILSKLLKEFAEKPDDAAVIDSSFATLFNPTSSFAGETARNKATRADALQGRSGESAPPSRGSSSHSRRSGRVGTSRNPNAMLKLDSKDMNGDTAIHIAARMGMDKVVTMLCDYSIRPVDIPNNAGEYPSMIAKNHAMYQLIKVCEDRIQLDSELRRVRQERLALQKQRRPHGGGSKPPSRGALS